MNEYNIAVLLPTRGRTAALEHSILSLVNTADNVDLFQMLLGFDRDDAETIDYFKQTLQPKLDDLGVNYQARVFEPLGYNRLNEYVNSLANCADADWLVFWNDDAVMETPGWDTVISKHTGEFKLLAFHTHRDHPYSIFPIVPCEWLELFGYLSPHPLSDAWLSQQAYVLDIWERIDVHVTHDRYDLTGNNQDSTYKKREILEGNPADPRDFHHITWHKKRIADLFQLASYMKSRGLNTDFFQGVVAGKQDPWEKLKANDINNQMSQWKADWTKQK